MPELVKVALQAEVVMSEESGTSLASSRHAACCCAGGTSSRFTAQRPSWRSADSATAL